MQNLCNLKRKKLKKNKFLLLDKNISGIKRDTEQIK